MSIATSCTCLFVAGELSRAIFEFMVTILKLGHRPMPRNLNMTLTQNTLLSLSEIPLG